MKCNLCGSEDNIIIYDWTRFVKNNVRQCNNCGLVFLELTKSKEEIEQFYQRKYRNQDTLPKQTAEQHYNDAVTIKDTNTQAEFILSKMDVRGKKILELGSASGRLLEKLHDEGAADVEGVELNDDYRAFSQSKGFKVHTNLTKHLASNKKYDAIVAFHVIEHFADPKESIREASASLKGGGIFIGEVPNQNEWGISIFDNTAIKRLHYNPDHYYYFTDKTLGRYLVSSGFIWTHFETYERYNSVMQLRNLLCGRYERTNIQDLIWDSIIPECKQDDYRLHEDNAVEAKFNTLFKEVVNEKLLGNCLRFVAENGRNTSVKRSN